MKRSLLVGDDFTPKKNKHSIDIYSCHQILESYNLFIIDKIKIVFKKLKIIYF